MNAWEIYFWSNRHWRCQNSHKEETKMKKWLMNFLKEEEGATVVEYAVMLVLIIVVAIATITIVGDKVNEGFQKVADELNTAL